MHNVGNNMSMNSNSMQHFSYENDANFQKDPSRFSNHGNGGNNVNSGSKSENKEENIGDFDMNVSMSLDDGKY